MLDLPASGLVAERTPATTQFLRAVENEDWAGALEVVEAHWLEIWFAVDPTDLQQVIAQASPQVLATLESVNYLARATGFGPVEDLHEPEMAPGRGASPAQVAQYIADLRLRGRPGHAMTYIRKHEADLRAQRGQLVDGSGGTTGVMLVQAGITALLAGETTAAVGMLLTAIDTHRPDRFPFVIREATAKLALAYAVTGNIREAALVNDQARQLTRTESWVEAMVDDTIWLTDYICAVDTFDPRAEAMRQAKGSPAVHREFWPVALVAQVRHLVLTNRPEQAAALCDAVAATGALPADADGMFATALTDARFLIGRRASAALHGAGATSSPWRVVARALDLFATGQFTALLELETPPTYDGRVTRALTVLRAQAKIAAGRVAEGRHVLQTTLRQALAHRTYGTLTYLSAEGLAQVSGTDEGVRAAEIIERHELPTAEVRAFLTAPLTAAEQEVMRALRDGLSRQATAEQLFVSVNTVKSQLSSAYRKLGVTNRTDALTRFGRLRS